MHCYFVRQSVENEKATLSKMFPSGNPFLSVAHDYFKESVLSNDKAETIFDLHCDSPVVATYILVRSDAALALKKYGAASLVAIDKITLSDSGTKLWQSTALELTCLESMCSGAALKLYKINWSACPFDEHLESDCGAVSFNKLSNPQLVLDTAAVAHKYYVYHKVLNMISITPQPGFLNSRIEVVSST